MGNLLSPSFNKLDWCRSRYMLLPRWPPFEDHPSSFLRRMDMQQQLSAGLDTSLAAHLIGPINFFGVWRTRCQSPSSMLGVWSFALASEREVNSKTRGRKSRKMFSSNLWRKRTFPLSVSYFVEVWSTSMLDFNVFSFILLWWPFNIFLQFKISLFIYSSWERKKEQDNDVLHLFLLS